MTEAMAEVKKEKQHISLNICDERIDIYVQPDAEGYYRDAEKLVQTTYGKFAEMFRGSHLILTPRESSTSEHLELMEALAAYIGCRDVVKTTPERHDRILAYTSQMMHMIAVSVCDDAELFTCKGYEGSSFRGCTRVAALDVGLWTQLFSLNAPALIERLDLLIEHLSSYRDVVASGDREALAAKLSVSAARKRQMDLPGPDLLH